MESQPRSVSEFSSPRITCIVKSTHDVLPLFEFKLLLINLLRI